MDDYDDFSQIPIDEQEEGLVDVPSDEFSQPSGLVEEDVDTSWTTTLPDVPEADDSAFDDADDTPLTPEDKPLAKGKAATEALARATGSAAAAAATAGKHLRDGFTAVKDVRAAAQRHSEAKSQVRALRAQLEEDRAVLDHRLQIEADYDRIFEEETAELESARHALDLANGRIQALAEERARIAAQLEALRVENEERLRPYKNLMDTTKGRADDTAVALADARRALRSAESQVNDATRRRDQRITAANRAVDNAAERLRRVQADFDKLNSDPNPSPTALPKLRDEIESERSRLAAAREDVSRVNEECKQAVDNAQAHVWAQKQALEAAEAQADDARRKATAAREEYDGLYKEAKAAEDDLEISIKDRTRLIADTEQERDAAQERIDSATAVLEEANEIHSTPQITAEMSARVQAAQDELDRRDEEVRNLAQSEKHLRASTRTKRIIFFAAIAVAVLLLCLVLWLVFFHKPKKPSTTTQSTPTTQTTQVANPTTDDGKADDDGKMNDAKIDAVGDEKDDDEADKTDETSDDAPDDGEDADEDEPQ